MKERMKQRLLSLLLAVGMICSLTAGMPVTAFGADQDIVVLYMSSSRSRIRSTASSVSM